MIIKTVEEAEEFVSRTPNFSWDGWNIVHSVQDDYAEYLLVGVFNKDDGRWYRRTVFPCVDQGWEIPDSVAR